MSNQPWGAALEPALGPCRPLPPAAVRLAGGLFSERSEATRRYLLRLDRTLLMQNHLHEAGLWPQFQDPEPQHGGWERPFSQLRGHFLGHWLSAAARFAAHGDEELRARIRAILADLERCQQANGGEWVFGIPPRYLDLLVRGQVIWAPQYTLHKTLMGLWDVWAWLGERPALELLIRAAAWFHRWIGTLDAAARDRVLDNEAGGMLEVWADLAAQTGQPEHRELVAHYYRAHLFDALKRGEDVLGDRHANAMLPEIIGALRAHEVTGDARWAGIAEGFWTLLERRGSWVTGGQSAGELWTPPGELAARLGNATQEHCVAYNLIRLAERLFQRSGEARYLDRIELLTWNGLLAQQHPRHGTPTYMLPLGPGGTKTWGSDLNHFWCCHGTQVQGNASHPERIAWATADGFAIGGWIPANLTLIHHGVTLHISIRDADADHDTFAPHLALPSARRPQQRRFAINVRASQAIACTLHLRLPGWLAAPATLLIGTDEQTVPGTGFIALSRTWQDDHLVLTLPMRLEAVPLPGDPARVAFREGPLVLAGLCSEERQLAVDAGQPGTTIESCEERRFGQWQSRWRLRDHPTGLRFLPLHEIVDETYTVYFPLADAPRASCRPPASG